MEVARSRWAPAVCYSRIFAIRYSGFPDTRHNVTCNVQVIKRVKPFRSLGNLVTLYRSIVEPYFSYCCIVWDGIGDTFLRTFKNVKIGQHESSLVLCTQNPLLKFVVSLVGYRSLR